MVARTKILRSLVSLAGGLSWEDVETRPFGPTSLMNAPVGATLKEDGCEIYVVDAGTERRLAGIQCDGAERHQGAHRVHGAAERRAGGFGRAGRRAGPGISRPGQNRERARQCGAGCDRRPISRVKG